MGYLRLGPYFKVFIAFLQSFLKINQNQVEDDGNENNDNNNVISLSFPIESKR